jgi:DNA-binding FadR family transcriptional regulator
VILDRIVSGAYPSGLRIPAENDLAGELGCGRSTVRESLRHLEGLGVVRSKRGSGAIVRDFKRDGRSLELMGPWIESGTFDQPLGVLARELLRMRTLLACEGARLAALYAKPGALQAARALVERSRALEGDPAAHALNDLEIHRALTAASRIWPAVWLSNALQGPLAELSRRFPALAVVPPGYAGAMNALLDLVEARQADAAADFVAGHLESVDDLVLQTLGPLADAPKTAAPSGRRRLAVGLRRDKK